MMPDWLRRLLGRSRPPPPGDGRVEALEREQARLLARLEALQISVDVTTTVDVGVKQGGEAGRETAGR